MKTRHAILLMLWAAAVCLALALLATKARASGIPSAAAGYQRVLVGEAQAVFGLSAPIARLAAQVHQESTWRADARSAHAEGLAQFRPSTAEWIAELFPKQLAPADPHDPRWAIRAMVFYDHWLAGRIEGRHEPLTECDRWAMVLSSYNGGLTWLQRDRDYTASHEQDPDRWFGSVEWHTRRAAWAMRENRAYVKRILLTLEPRYIRAGWHGEAACVG